MDHRYRASQTLAVLGIAVGLAAPTSVRGVVSKIQLKAEATAFAFNPERGELAAVNYGTGEIFLYRSAFFEGDATAFVGPVTAGHGPGRPAFKKFGDEGYLVVPCYREPKLLVFDAATLDLVKAIDVGTTENSGACGSLNPDDPYVYYLGKLERSKRIGRVDLNEMADAGSFWNQDRYSPAPRVSADGRTLYLNSGGYEIIEPEGGGGVQLAIRNASEERRGVALPDFMGEFAAIESKLFDASLMREHLSFDFEVAGFHPSRPLVMGFKDGDMHSASTNTFRTKATVAVDLPTTKYSDEKFDSLGLDYNKRILLIDLKPSAHTVRDAGVILAVREGDTVVVVPEKDLDPSPEPTLNAHLKGSGRVIVGETTEILLQLSGEGVSASLATAPEGAKLEGGKITWSPGDGDVGPLELALLLESGGVQRTKHFPLQVARPSIAMPFVPRALAVSPDGKLVVAWRRDDDGPISMATFNGADLTLIAHREIPDRQLLEVVTDGKSVILRSKGASDAEVLSAETLERVRSLSLGGTVVMQVIEGGKYLAMYSGSRPPYGRGTRLLQLPDFTELPEGSIAEHPRSGSPTVKSLDDTQWARDPLIEKIGDVTVIDSTGFTPDLKKIVYVPTAPFPSYVQGRYRGGAPRRWNRMVRGRDLHRGNGYDSRDGGKMLTLDEDFSHSFVIKLDAIPAAAVFSWQATGGRSRSGFVGGCVRLVDLVTGKPRLSYTLTEREVLHPISTMSGGNPGWVQVAAGRRLFAALGERVYRIELDDDEVGEAFPEPLNFEPVQSAMLVDPDGQTKLEHRTLGGVPPFKFELENDLDCLKIDSATGEVTVDGALAMQVATRAVLGVDYAERRLIPELQRRRNALGFTFHGMGKLAPDAIVETLLGRRIAGFPMSMRIHVKAEDAEGDTAEIAYRVLLEVPPKLMNEVIDSLGNPTFASLKRDETLVLPDPAPQPLPEPEPDPASAAPAGGGAQEGAEGKGSSAREITQLQGELAEVRERLASADASGGDGENAESGGGSATLLILLSALGGGALVGLLVSLKGRP